MRGLLCSGKTNWPPFLTRLSDPTAGQGSVEGILQVVVSLHGRQLTVLQVGEVGRLDVDVAAGGDVVPESDCESALVVGGPAQLAVGLLPVVLVDVQDRD